VLFSKHSTDMAAQLIWHAALELLPLAHAMLRHGQFEPTSVQTKSTKSTLLS